MAMTGPAYFNESFSERFRELLENEINDFGISNMSWEEFYAYHIRDLTLNMKLGDSSNLLEFESIEVIYVEEGKTFAVLDDKRTYRVKLRLYEVESLLPPNFKKLSKSVIGNMKKIDRFSSTITGAVDAVFKCGRKEFVSRRCLAEIKRGLKK